MVDLLFLDSKLSFGAHKGKTVAQVLRENPSYLRWAFNNTNKVSFSLEVSSALKAAMAKPSYQEKYPNGSSVVLSSRRKRKEHYKRTRTIRGEAIDPYGDDGAEDLNMFGVNL